MASCFHTDHKWTVAMAWLQTFFWRRVSWPDLGPVSPNVPTLKLGQPTPEYGVLTPYLVVGHSLFGVNNSVFEEGTFGETRPWWPDLIWPCYKKFTECRWWISFKSQTVLACHIQPFGNGTRKNLRGVWSPPPPTVKNMVKTASYVLFFSLFSRIMLSDQAVNVWNS